MSFDSPDWTLREVLLWVCLRSAAAFDISDDVNPAAYVEALEHWARKQDLLKLWMGETRFSAPEVAVVVAEAQIVAALAENRLTASGVWCGSRQALPVHSWSARHLLWRSNEVIDSVTRERWSDILIPRASVLAIWRAKAPRQRGRKAGVVPVEKLLIARALDLFAPSTPARHGDYARWARQLQSLPEFNHLAEDTIARLLRRAPELSKSGK